MSAFVSAIIVAAGGSTRMGISDSKQFIPLLGKPAISYTLSAFQKCAFINEIVVVSRAQDINRIFALAQSEGFDKVSAVVEGGPCRAASVKNGMLAADAQAEYLAIHDGARPLITTDEITAVVEAAFETGAATVGTAVTDTIKIADENSYIVNTQCLTCATPTYSTCTAWDPSVPSCSRRNWASRPTMTCCIISRSATSTAA